MPPRIKDTESTFLRFIPRLNSQKRMEEYDKFIERMNTPRVVVDNVVSAAATVVKVDSARERGVLLEVLSVLADLDLTVRKAYISTDGQWFMNVFHITDRRGRKLADRSLAADLERSLCASRNGDDDGEDGHSAQSPSLSDLTEFQGATELELAGADRPGLLSEIFAVLRDLECDVAEAKVWTHNGRIAAVVTVRDAACPGSPADDEEAIRIHRIKTRLRNVLAVRGTRTVAARGSAALSDRRMNQLMFEERDFEHAGATSPLQWSSSVVSVQNWMDRGYSIVNVKCRDRPKLLFDMVCTLMDMEYVVFHGTADTDGNRAYQEFYIRHSDGTPINSEAERHRLIQCVQAAIDRRAPEGEVLELRTADRRGLLAEVTQTFREHGLSVTRVEVTTEAGVATNVFHVADTAGHPVDPRTVESIAKRIGAGSLKLSEERRACCRQGWPSAEDEVVADGGSRGGGAGLFYLGSIVKRNLYNLGLIRSRS